MLFLVCSGQARTFRSVFIPPPINVALPPTCAYAVIFSSSRQICLSLIRKRRTRYMSWGRWVAKIRGPWSLPVASGMRWHSPILKHSDTCKRRTTISFCGNLLQEAFVTFIAYTGHLLCSTFYNAFKTNLAQIWGFQFTFS